MDGHVYYGQRGKTAVKAVDHDTELGKLFPIVADLDDARESGWNFQEISREEVPDPVLEHLETAFENRQKAFEKITAFTNRTPDDGGGE